MLDAAVREHMASTAADRAVAGGQSKIVISTTVVLIGLLLLILFVLIFD